jgi:hypothetical protein
MPMNRPSAAELLDAMSKSLQSAEPADPATSAFGRRIAVNVLKILEREATLGPSFLRDEQQRLRHYLGRDGDLAELNADLCDRIASGAEDARWQELVALLRLTTLDKLAVDNPRFPAYRQIIGQSQHTVTP